MWALEILGLESDADERAIKRAYAKALKTTRPDEDPEGFQRLYTAYQSALTWRENHPLSESASIESHEENNATGSFDTPNDHAWTVTLPQTPDSAGPLEIAPEKQAGEPQESVPGIEQKDYGLAFQSSVFSWQTTYEGDNLTHEREEKVPFDFNAFYVKCIEIAWQESPDNLSTWLHSVPDLWDIELKHVIGKFVLGYLFDGPPSINPVCFDVLVQFFALEEISAEVDFVKLLILKKRIEAAWLVDTRRPEYHQPRSQLREKTYPFSDSVLPQGLLEQLKRPFSWPQVITASFPPWKATRWARKAAAIDARLGEFLTEHVDAQQMAYWAGMSFNSTLCLPRLILIFSCLLILLVGSVAIFGVCAGVMFLDGHADAKSMQSLVINMSVIIGLCFIIGFGASYYFWQTCPDERIHSKFWRTITQWWIPCLCLITVILYMLEMFVVANVIGAIAAVTGWLRLSGRSGSLWENPTLVILLMVCTSVLGIPIALATWGWDYYTHLSMRFSSKDALNPQLDKQLRRRFSWWQIFFASFPPWRAYYWHWTLAKWLKVKHHELPEAFDRRQSAYWQQKTSTPYFYIFQGILLFHKLFIAYGIYIAYKIVGMYNYAIRMNVSWADIRFILLPELETISFWFLVAFIAGAYILWQTVPRAMLTYRVARVMTLSTIPLLFVVGITWWLMIDNELNPDPGLVLGIALATAIFRLVMTELYSDGQLPKTFLLAVYFLVLPLFFLVTIMTQLACSSTEGVLAASLLTLTLWGAGLWTSRASRLNRKVRR